MVTLSQQKEEYGREWFRRGCHRLGEIEREGDLAVALICRLLCVCVTVDQVCPESGGAERGVKFEFWMP